jgi:hypothetical protein
MKQLKLTRCFVVGMFAYLPFASLLSAQALVTPDAAIEIEVNGAWEGKPGETTPEVCARDFMLSADQIKTFFALSASLSATDYEDSLYSGRDINAYCYARGSVELPNGDTGRWRITSERVGTLSAGDRTVHLWCGWCQVRNEVSGEFIARFNRPRMARDFVSKPTSITIETNGAHIGTVWEGKHTMERCSRFLVDQDDVWAFLQLAVEANEHASSEDLGECLASGTARLADGRQVRWQMTDGYNSSLSVGNSTIALVCPRCRSPVVGAPEADPWEEPESHYLDMSEEQMRAEHEQMRIANGVDVTRDVDEEALPDANH